ncbi:MULTISPECIES: hypothetical protein [unclassified Clostridium]|uniref:hypothetical protein n=1 Tax=unclassified Clostridium TaxID=2614128 RepID=UPI000297654A|nr:MULTISPECIES: hypothetical protein [unclassified Clostridium]EKQ57607.1 MAG: hypothetical protein A370_00739 [Clostridium sp. Maddingley MBC34-26]
MSVDRNISIRLLTNLDNFSDIIMILIKEGFSFSENGKIVSLSEDDTDDFNYMEFDSFSDVTEIFYNREKKGYINYIVIWDNNLNESFLVSCTTLEKIYGRYKNHYEVNFNIGHGIRIKGADRFTDFGIYLNKLIPIFVKNTICICEINCSDCDC